MDQQAIYKVVVQLFLLGTVCGVLCSLDQQQCCLAIIPVCGRKSRVLARGRDVGIEGLRLGVLGGHVDKLVS